MNAASEIFLDLFGERGGHTRFVAGCSSLPYDLAVEIEAVVQLR
jgi:enamine deaminase RidA (YjgF/YER057c/UK114 family)